MRLAHPTAEVHKDIHERCSLCRHKMCFFNKEMFDWVCYLPGICADCFLKNPAAVSLGKLGGSVRSDKKAAAARRNGKKGGRPRIVSFIWRGELLTGKVIERHRSSLTVSVPRNPWTNVRDLYTIGENEIVDKQKPDA